jgi:hypothetical protein
MVEPRMSTIAIRRIMYTIPIIRRSAGSIFPSAIAAKKLRIAKVDEPTPSEIEKL